MQRRPSEVYSDDESSSIDASAILDVESTEVGAQASADTSSNPRRSSPSATDKQHLHKQVATLIHRPFEDGPVLLHPDRRLRGPFASFATQPTNGRIYASGGCQDAERSAAAAALKTFRGFSRRTGVDNDCIINTVDSDNDDDDDDYSCSSDDAARCREAMMMTTTAGDRQNNDDDDDEMSEVIEWNRNNSPSSSPSKTQDADSQGHQRDNRLLGLHGNKGNRR